MRTVLERPRSVSAAASARRYRPWQAAAVVGASFAANGLAARRRPAPALPNPPGTPPDWVFLLTWPLLKGAAASADLRIANSPPSRQRSMLVGQRAVEWLAFASFTAVGPGTGRPLLVLASTATQTALTTASVRRAWAQDRPTALLLTPQLLWLGYASALTVYGVLNVARSTKPRPRAGKWRVSRDSFRAVNA